MTRPGIVFLPNRRRRAARDQAGSVGIHARLPDGPGGAALLIEGLTDNKNRTTAEVRNLLNKRGGSLAGAGSTAFMFAKKGYLEIEKSKAICK